MIPQLIINNLVIFNIFTILFVKTNKTDQYFNIKKILYFFLNDFSLINFNF